MALWWTKLLTSETFRGSAPLQFAGSWLPIPPADASGYGACLVHHTLVREACNQKWSFITEWTCFFNVNRLPLSSVVNWNSPSLCWLIFCSLAEKSGAAVAHPCVCVCARMWWFSHIYIPGALIDVSEIESSYNCRQSDFLMKIRSTMVAFKVSNLNEKRFHYFSFFGRFGSAPPWSRSWYRTYFRFT